MKKFSFRFLTGILSIFVLLTFSCANLLEERSEPNAESGFGSIEVTTGSQDSRALYIKDIDKADVTVSGYDMGDITEQNVIVASGRGSAVAIKGIKIGKNRVVSVEAKTTIGTVLSKMDGVVIRQIAEIKSDDTTPVSVSWESSKIANVYYYLIKNHPTYDVSKLDSATVAGYLPGVHASLIDVETLAKDIAAGSVKSKDFYKMAPGSVTFKTDIAKSNYKVQICDPISTLQIGTTASNQTISNVAPGRWNFYIINSSGTIIHTKKAVNVKSGESVSLGNIRLQTPKPRLEDKQGKEITDLSIITGASKTVYLSCRTLDGETPLNATIYYTTNGTTPTTSSTVYNPGTGISVKAGDTIKAFAVSAGLEDSETVAYAFVSQVLGKTYPASGVYSPVNQSSWATATYKGGAKLVGGNMQVAVYSANATKMLLEIYMDAYGKDATYDYWMTKGSDNWWRAEIAGVPANTLYAFRAWGPNWTYSDSWKRGGSDAGFVKDCDANGNRFNPNKVLFDPYAKELTHDTNSPKLKEYDASFDYGKYFSTGATNRNYDSGKYVPKGVLIDDKTSFGTKPAIAQKDALIYETHVRGLTKHPSTANLSTILSGIDGFGDVQNIPAEYAGTYKGATYMIPYLKALGINTVELLPVHESENDGNPDDAPGGNYWAYMTFDYFAPDRRYSSDKSLGGPTKEFKEMVKAFHDAGMEVYLDVVYNHSGEGGAWHGNNKAEDFDNYAQCTVVSMRGLDNSTYYSLVKDNKASYWESTGCGNNLQCDNPYVRQFILDSLTYWIDEMGVDGFRFDLATVLGRELNSEGNWGYNNTAKTLVDIAALGASKNVEMIAESWDCGGDGYVVGNFPAGWGGWNGRFRDALRGYVGGGNRGSVCDYINGDYDNFNKEGGPHKTVNFIVAHDGFTLADLCSYSGKGNAQNSILEWPFGKSDGGNSDNNSTVFGDDKGARRQAFRNYSTIQMFSRGVPMIVWGDEFGRTQNGNNNPYNIDSVATWNNYNMINTDSPHAVATGGGGAYHNNFGTDGKADSLNGNFLFMKYLMNLRANEPALKQDNYSSVTYTFKKENGTDDLSDSDKCVWIKISGAGANYLMFMNMHYEQVSYTIPAASAGKEWKRLIDTQNYFESDLNCWSESDAVACSEPYGVAPYSVVILKECVSKPKVATPVISGTTPFTTSTSVTITCGTAGATIYYTTDGSTPSATNGTRYTSAISLSSTKTVKAVAVLANYNNSAVAEKQFRKSSGALPPVNKSGVMLQGFNWDSAPRPGKNEDYSMQKPSPHWGKWYKTVTNNANAIKNTFEYVWCPPPSMTDTNSSEGYAPTQLNNLNNCYGTEADQIAMINAIKPAKAIADIVINHRGGTTCWGDFTNPSFGVVKGSNYKAICSDDEGFGASGDSHMNGVSVNMRGAFDTGDGYAAYRDLDHTNPDVQNGITTWMNDVLKAVGYVGWRYDYVKGYGGRYVGQYNAAAEPVLSVGEYWPSAGYDASNSSAWGNEIKDWISATQTGGFRSKAFDFALKGAMNTIFGFTSSNGTGAGSFNYGHLADAANLVISQPEDAVTFVDNHDTGSTQAHWTLNPNYVGVAYAFILTHPGVPCVAWQHYFTYAQSGNTKSGSSQYLAGNTVAGTSNTLRQHIDQLITLRKSMGIEYDSVRTNVATTNSHYVADVKGKNGTLRVCIGNGYTPPTGAVTEKTYEGTNFTIWKVNTSYVPTTEKVTLYCQNSAGYGNTIYFIGSFDESENWTKMVRGTWNTGNVWTAEVTHETGTQFEWKVLKYESGSDETVKILPKPASGATWQPDPNNVHPTKAAIAINDDFNTVSNYTPPANSTGGGW